MRKVDSPGTLDSQRFAHFSPGLHLRRRSAHTVEAASILPKPPEKSCVSFFFNLRLLELLPVHRLAVRVLDQPAERLSVAFLLVNGVLAAIEEQGQKVLLRNVP